MTESVLVEFDDDDRIVLLDDRPGGHTNVPFDTNTGTHKFSLDGKLDFAPSSQIHVVKDTSGADPFVVKFEKIDAVGGGDG